MKYDEGDNLIAIVSGEVLEGFIHYVKTGDQSGNYVPCQGGKAGKGFDPPNCKVCAEVKRLYAIKRRLQGEGKEDVAEALGKRAYDLRANLTYFWVAKKGRKVVVEKDGEEKTKIKYESEPDDDGKSTPIQEQKLRMTSKHWLTVKTLVGDANVPQLKKTSDLLEFVLNFKKEKPSGKKKYGEIVPKATKLKIKTEIDETRVKGLLEENANHIKPLEDSSVETIIKEYQDVWGDGGSTASKGKGGAPSKAEAESGKDDYESEPDTTSDDDEWDDDTDDKENAF